MGLCRRPTDQRDLKSGAGGQRRLSGDGNPSNQTNAGLWGQLRVHRMTKPDLLPLG